MPQTAAVTIIAHYASVMTRIRECVKLRELGITVHVVKNGITGATIIEIAGSRPDKEDKADVLASHIQKALDGWEDVKVGRPHKVAEI